MVWVEITRKSLSILYLSITGEALSEKFFSQKFFPNTKNLLQLHVQTVHLIITHHIIFADSVG